MKVLLTLLVSVLLTQHVANVSITQTVPLDYSSIPSISFQQAKGNIGFNEDLNSDLLKNVNENDVITFDLFYDSIFNPQNLSSWFDLSTNNGECENNFNQNNLDVMTRAGSRLRSCQGVSQRDLNIFFKLHNAAKFQNRFVDTMRICSKKPPFFSNQCYDKQVS